MRIIYIIWVLLLVLFSCDTENNVDHRFEQYFIKYYGEEGNQMGVDVKALPDGFIILGNSTSIVNNAQIFLVRVDELGNEVWAKNFGGPDNEVAAAIAIDANGDYVIAATVQTGTNDKDIMILKVDEQGEKIDSALFGAVGKDDVANSILITREGDYIVTGYTTNVDTSKPGYLASTDLADIYSVRTNADLVQFQPADWRTTYGFPGVDKGVEMRQKEDGSFLFFGTTNKPPTANTQQSGFNMFLFPAGSDGIAISATQFQLFGTLSNESASQIIQTSEGGFSMLGTSSGTGATLPYLARVRSSNEFINAETISLEGNVEGNSLAASANGGFLMLGKASENNNTNIHLLKLSVNGAVIWEKSFGGVDNDLPGKVLELEDGSLALVGTITLESQSKICLIKTTADGELMP